MPSQRRAKQTRRIVRIMETGTSDRHKVRPKRFEADSESIGWQNMFVKMYKVARGLE